MHEKVLVLDFGSQYTQLIARRLRELRVYCEIRPCTLPDPEIRAFSPRAIVLSGGPASAFEAESPKLPGAVLALGVPVLGICYGEQLLAAALGGRVEPGRVREYGPAEIELLRESPLFDGILRVGERARVWMSHGDRVTALPPGFAAVARSPASPFAAIADEERKLYGVQFHPEVAHTPIGKELLANFCFRIARLRGDWTMAAFRAEAVAAIRARVGSGRVLLGLSGGVDSAVAALLLHEAIGERLVCVFVDTGLLRLGEAREVVELFRGHFNVPLVAVDASSRFFAALRGITDPEEKRKTIGRVFVEVFEEEAARLGPIDFLAQGTLYPDVIESVSFRGPSATIKSHHNVGGLPERMRLTLVEPLRELFKDEVRELGRELGLSEAFVGRHPFPGPGLAVRVLGEVTPERVALLQKADAIFLEEIRRAGLYDRIWQAFAVLLPVRSVGVMGDRRTYEETCALRAVTSEDGMTADVFPFAVDFLARVANRIVNEVRGINRVVYDVTSKPPGTIEWE
ncbi:MAG: glutamine-hydrolyzing GMP synthase [Geminicoccaceae bacterium]|nr:glutamine-hydrolyzing GMP synthase [Geminicoccaceae bacterium]MCS7269161.1 glutamine-hydrolyzing GMP synthase [Geminicoccaceae bacterium]MDW8125758.1 glutamine-hydrolyzing GMP synthase [Geminicoccaceae bacterium]MDW8342762.1 glutamine-hydrolyzing GMP synthase [Geminicoccaceae bacterium]